jgi:hypothetical protein
MSLISCARCGISVFRPESGLAPLRWWRAVDANSDHEVVACASVCTAHINEQREAAGLGRWRWWYEDGSEPGDSNRLELAMWLLRADEEFRAARQAVTNREPEARGRYAATKKNLDDAFATSTVILLGQTAGFC